MITYIYTLTDPRDSQCRYVGKTKNPLDRSGKHKSLSNNKNLFNHTANWLVNLLSDGYEPIFEIIDEIEGKNWQWLEIYWIAQFRAWGFDLTNLTEGGDGIDGYSHTNESKHKISESSKKLWQNKEHIDKMKLKHKGLKNPFSDKTIYSFYHDVYGEVSLTQSEMRKKFNLPICLNGVVKGKKFSIHGWKLLINRNNLSKSFNNNKYIWNHVKYGERICRKIELMNEFPELRQDALCKLMRGKQSNHLGWVVNTKEWQEKYNEIHGV